MLALETPVAYTPQEYFPDPKGERVKIPGGILPHKVDTTMFKGTGQQAVHCDV